MKKITILLVMAALSMTMVACNSDTSTQQQSSTMSGAYLGISAPDESVIQNGDDISFEVSYTGDIANVILDENALILNGFDADISIEPNDNNIYSITLSDIQGDVGGDKTISITGGTAMSSTGELSNSVLSKAFTIESTTNPSLEIYNPSKLNINAGDNVSFTLSYSDDIGVANVWLDSGTIILKGFTADISIKNITTEISIVTLTNIMDIDTEANYIAVTGGTAIDEDGNLSNLAYSQSFNIV